MKEKSLSEFSESERERAYQKYQIIETYLHNDTTLKAVANTAGIPLRTLTVWLKKYRALGLVGLARQSRKDKGISRKWDLELQKAIEGVWGAMEQLWEASHNCSIAPQTPNLINCVISI